MGSSTKAPWISHAKQAANGFEAVSLHRRHQCRIASGASALNEYIVGADQPLCRQIIRAAHHVLCIRFAPPAGQTKAEIPTRTGAAGIVHLRYGKAPLTPELDLGL